jgi:hypothetical protein
MSQKDILTGILKNAYLAQKLKEKTRVIIQDLRELRNT